MFSRFYKIHFWLLVVGVTAFFPTIFFTTNPLITKYEFIFKFIATLLFLLSMIFYYKIISILTTVATVTKVQMYASLTSHIVTLISLYFSNNRTIFYILFISSILVRNFLGIIEIDRQMKSLCNQIDLELYCIGKEEENAKEN